MSSETITLKNFDMSRLKSDSIVVVIGKRNTGKSCLVKDLLYHKRDIPLGVVVSKTDHLNKFYSKFIPDMFIHNQYSSDILKKIFERQKKAIYGNWKNPNSFFLMDDCLSEGKTWRNDSNLQELFFNGRWYKLLFILSMQAPMGLPPGLRSNIDFTFILKCNNASDRVKIREHYAGAIPKDKFDIIFDACTNDYHCLVIDNTTQSNKLEDQVFIYKATNFSRDFRIGSDKLWRENDNYISNNKGVFSNDNNSDSGNKYTLKGNKKLILNIPKY